MLNAILRLRNKHVTNHTNRVSPSGQPILKSGVFEEQLGEQARVGSPFCCLPHNIIIKAVKNFPNNSGRGLYACSNSMQNSS